MPHGSYRLHTKSIIFSALHNNYIQANVSEKSILLTFFSHLSQSKVVLSTICSITYITFFTFIRKPLGAGTVFY